MPPCEVLYALGNISLKTWELHLIYISFDLPPLSSFSLPEISIVSPEFPRKINLWGPLKTTQMLGARKRATGAYLGVREDREFAGNKTDG